MNQFPLAILCGLTLAACAGGPYAYRPAEEATATVRGQVAARYAIPPEAPRGDVRLASFGIAELEMEEGDEEIDMLHVRMVVSNESDQPWSIDTRQVVVTLPGAGSSRPAYVNTDQNGMPVIPVPPRQQRTLDLYYPLPEDRQHARELPEFDVSWQVRTGERVVSERTPFDRYELSTYPQYAYGGWYGGGGWPYWGAPIGWGPVWWYDPFYTGLSFRTPVVLHSRYPDLRYGPSPTPHRVYIGTPPAAPRRR
jgi:hypothetical protein